MSTGISEKPALTSRDNAITTVTMRTNSTIKPTTLPAFGECFTRSQVAAALGVTTKTVTAFTGRGARLPGGRRLVLPRVTIGGKLWFRSADVTAFCDKLVSGPGDDANEQPQPATQTKQQTPRRRRLDADTAAWLAANGFTPGNN